MVHQKERETFIEVLTRDVPADEVYEKVMSSGIFEKGIEQGRLDGREEDVWALFDFGMSKEDISKALRIDLNVVQDILS